MENEELGKQKETIKAEVDKNLACDIVYDLYGIKAGKVRELNGYDDRNFHIEADNTYENPYINSICTSGYTLKVINKMDSKETDFIDAMDCLLFNCYEQKLNVPIPVRNKFGSLWSIKLLSDKNNERSQHVIRLLTYLPGETIFQIPYTASVLFQWGKLLARFHQNVKNFSHAALNKRQSPWSLSSVPKISDYLFCIENEERRLLINDIINEFESMVLKEVEHLPTGIVHGDFNEHNILARKINNDYDVYGILDFGDVHVAPIIFDVSVMLTYTMLEGQTMDFTEACGHALAGYTSVLSLSQREFKMIRVCMLARLSQSLVMGAYTNKLDPLNVYALSTARMGWTILPKLRNTSEEKLQEIWKNIIRTYN